MKIKSKKLNGLIFAILGLLTLSYLYPIYYMFINSFKGSTEYYYDKFALPAELNWNNFKVMFSQFDILHYFRNSFVVALGVVCFVTVLGVLAAYGFSKLPFRGSSGVYLAMVLTMMVPAQVTVIPMYTLFAKLHMNNTLRGIILCYLATALPSAIMLLTANFRGISNELLESASIDGCGYFQRVLHIILPVGKTAIILNAIFNFVWTWNDLFMPTILLQKNEVKTVMVALSTLVSRYSKEPTLQLTGLLLCAFPTLIVYCFCQKYIVKGVAMGALK
ncbi:MAG: carbohydrate ABC transporter permease [Candidatus Avoscillospira sp.]